MAENRELRFTMTIKEGTSKTGNRFPIRSTQINGVWYKVKFPKSVTNAPDKRGVYDIITDVGSVGVQKPEYYTAKDGTEKLGAPTLWIRGYKSLRQFTEEELEEINRERTARALGLYETDAGDELPF